MSTDDTTNAPGSDDAAASEVPRADLSRNEAAPSAPARREAVREKALQVRVRQSRARWVRRTVVIGAAVAIVAALGVGVAWAVGGTTGKRQLSPPNASQDGFAVTTVLSSGAVVAPDAAATPTAAEATPEPSATAAAPVAIRVYVDYLSPAAREWQLANSAQLSNWVADGAATLTYHPVAMLTAKSNGTKYSLRAASAAACVATYSPDSFFGFNDDLLTRQPAVDSDGFSDKDLADIAVANGTADPKGLRECIETQAFTGWVKAATERAVTGIEGIDGLSLTGNSLITVNGQAYVGEMGDAGEFAQFVLTSASGKSAKAHSGTPTPTPTPTPSVTP